jgi:hypothetical protein
LGRVHTAAARIRKSSNHGGGGASTTPHAGTR